MRSANRRRRLLGVILAASTIALVSPALVNAESCRRINNPYAGSRYEGTDLRRIQAKNVTCAKAREVVRKAHRKAFRVSKQNYEWHAWKIRSDLSGNTDQYRARRGDARIHWVF